MRQQQEQMLATVDERRARFFRCRPTPRATWRLQEDEALRSVWEQDHERGRPAMLGSAGGSMPPQPGGRGHAEEESCRRFAREVADRLKSVAMAPDGEPILVFAAPRFLGALREFVGEHPGIRLIEGELTRLQPHQLAEHVTVVSQLQKETSP